MIFLVEEAPEGGFTARALGEPIFTEADDIAGLHVNVRSAVRCHFDDDKVPRIIRLHFVREEAISGPDGGRARHGMMEKRPSLAGR